MIKSKRYTDYPIIYFKYCKIMQIIIISVIIILLLVNNFRVFTYKSSVSLFLLFLPFFFLFHPPLLSLFLFLS